MAPEKPAPVAGDWYKDLEQEELFTVTAVDTEKIHVQYADGNLESLDYGSWETMAIDLANPPEAWQSDFNVGEMGYWDRSAHPEGAPRPESAVEGAEPDLGPQKTP